MPKTGVCKNGPVRRTIHALCGEVDLDRQRYRCRACGRTFYAPNPFFDTLGRGLITEEVWRIGLQLGVYVAYGRASTMVEQATGAKVSASALQREVVSRGLAESKAMGEASHEQATFRSLPDPASPSRARGRHYVEMDGCFVHRWRQRASFELKVGNVFSDPILTESGERKWIEHREYVGYSGDSETFGERLFSCGERFGVSEAEELYVLGDGASWIRSLHSQYFPHGQLILDWWHLQKTVWETLRSVVKEESGQKRYGEATTSTLYVGDVDRALRMIKRLPASTRKREEKRDALAQYINSNRHTIPSYEATKAQGVHIGDHSGLSLYQGSPSPPSGS